MRDGLIGAVQREALSRSAASPFEYVTHGHAAWGRDDNDGWRAARLRFDRALAIDPNHLPALGAIG